MKQNIELAWDEQSALEKRLCEIPKKAWEVPSQYEIPKATPSAILSGFREFMSKEEKERDEHTGRIVCNIQRDFFAKGLPKYFSTIQNGVDIKVYPELIQVESKTAYCTLKLNWNFWDASKYLMENHDLSQARELGYKPDSTKDWLYIRLCYGKIRNILYIQSEKLVESIRKKLKLKAAREARNRQRLVNLGLEEKCTP